LFSIIIIMMFLLVVLLIAMLVGMISPVVTASPFPPLTPTCSRKDQVPRIPAAKCKPDFRMAAKTCNKLIRQCQCQHNIRMKLVGAACAGTRGNGVSPQ